MCCGQTWKGSSRGTGCLSGNWAGLAGDLTLTHLGLVLSTALLKKEKKTPPWGDDGLVGPVYGVSSSEDVQQLLSLISACKAEQKEKHPTKTA